MSYKIEIIERKDLIVQLEESKLRIKSFFGDLLKETKSLKYQITIKRFVKKIQA